MAKTPVNTLAGEIALSVVVPCYNECESVAELYRRVGDACREAVGDAYEMVLVIDGATDGTREAIFDLARRDGHVVGIDLARNYGHQIALSAGLEFCRGRRVLVLDADLQDPPELLRSMMARMDEGYDVVYGQRVKRDGESLFKRSSAAIFYRVLRKMVDVDIAADTGDFRLMSRRAVDQLNAMPERYRFVRGMVSWIGLRQTAFPYERHPRFAGTTHYPLGAMIRFAIDAITGFSTVPLRIATYLGFAGALVGVFFMGWTVYSYVTGITVQGWTTLMAPILILGSTQLLVLGVIGEYLGRLYMQSKNRPLYIIDEIRCRESAARYLAEPTVSSVA